MTINTQKLRETARLLSSHRWNCLTPLGVEEVLAAADIIEALEGQVAEYARMLEKQGAEAGARIDAQAAEIALLREALKKCAAVCAGETSHKQGLIDALEAARAALAQEQGEKHDNQS